MAAPEVTPSGGSAMLEDLNADLQANHDNIETHKGDTANPHGVTPAQIGAATAAQGAKADSAVQPADLAGATAKASIVAGDWFSLVDSEDSNSLKRFSFSNLRSYLRTTGFDAVYQPLDGVLTGTTASFTTELAAQLAAASEASEANTLDVVRAAAWQGRPGDAPQHFSHQKSGAPEDRPVLTAGSVETNAAMGQVWRVTGADIPAAQGYRNFAARTAIPVVPGRVTEIAARLQRIVDSVDPEDDAVEILFQPLGAGYAAIGAPVRAGSLIDLRTSDGATRVAVTLAQDSDTDAQEITGSARYIVPLVRIYGTTATTDIAEISSRDVTDSYTSGVNLDLKADLVDGTVPLSQLPEAALGGNAFQGTWDADANDPTIPAAASDNRGHYYRVATAGTTEIDGISTWNVGDTIISNGAAWERVATTATVQSVAGRTGDVTLSGSDVGLGNVDNTPDADKPISTAQQAAFDVEEATRRTSDRTLGKSLTPAGHRDSFSGPYVAPFVDRAGKAIAGVQADAFGAAAYRVLLPDSRAGHEFPFAIRDEAGKVAVAVTYGGEAWASALRMPENPARMGSAYLWSLRDLLGDLAVGVLPTGRVHIPEMEVPDVDAPTREGMPVFPWSVRDATGAVAFGASRRGGLSVTYIDVPLPDNPPRGGEPEFIWSVGAEDGATPLGVRPDGTAFLRQRYLTPSDFSATIPVGNVRDYGDFLVAARIDAMQYDVRRKVAGTAALIQHPEPMIFLPVYGQSNAGAQGPLVGELYEGNAYPEISVMFSAAVYLEGGDAVPASALNDIRPSTDAGYDNQFLPNVAAQSLEFITRERDFKTTPGVLGISVFEGSEEIESFEEGASGHHNYGNLMAAAGRAAVVAEDYGRDIDCPAVVFIQGENPSADYAASLQALAAAVTSDIQTEMALDAAPLFLAAQINSQDNANSAITVPADQLASHDVGQVRVLGPMYQYPLHDSIHINTIGKMMMADCVADVLRVVRETGDWTPLMMTSAVRSGAVVDVTFAVPGDGLCANADWVQEVSNLGFSWADDDGSAAVQSAEIIDETTVRVTLDAAPTGANPLLRYAVYGYAVEDGWATGRGMLYSPTRSPSLYHHLGHAVPSHARHYACRQTIEVTT